MAFYGSEYLVSTGLILAVGGLTLRETIVIAICCSLKSRSFFSKPVVHQQI